MKLVIDIPEEDYIRLRDEGMFGNVSTFKRAVREGIPLPKRHGRLIILSEDAIKREQIALGFSCQLWMSEVDLSNATVAIIEADKEDEE